MNIAINVDGQVLTATPAAILVSQSVGVVTFSCTFDNSWDGLTKKVVFRNGGRKKELIYTDGQALVPWEVLQCDGYLWISVVGYADGKQQPTAEMDIPLSVGRSGAIQGDSPQNYTPPLWQQVSNQVALLGQKVDAFLPAENGEQGQALFAAADGNIWDWPGVRTFESVMDYQLSGGAGASILYTYVLPDGDGNGGSGNGIYVQSSAHFGGNWYLRIVDQGGNRIVNQQPFYSAMAMRINASSGGAVITIIQFSGLSEVYDLDVSAKTLTKRPNIGIPTPDATGADDGKILAVTNNAYALADPPSDLPTPTTSDAGKVPTVNADGTGYELAPLEQWELVETGSLVDVAHIEKTFAVPYCKITLYMMSIHPNGGATAGSATHGGWKVYVNNLNTNFLVGTTSHAWGGRFRYDAEVQGELLKLSQTDLTISGAPASLKLYCDRKTGSEINKITIDFTNADNLATTGKYCIYGVKK